VLNTSSVNSANGCEFAFWISTREARHQIPARHVRPVPGHETPGSSNTTEDARPEIVACVVPRSTCVRNNGTIRSSKSLTEREPRVRCHGTCLFVQPVSTPMASDRQDFACEICHFVWQASDPGGASTAIGVFMECASVARRSYTLADSRLRRQSAQ
jgi:hypothetical protein